VIRVAANNRLARHKQSPKGGQGLRPISKAISEN